MVRPILYCVVFSIENVYYSRVAGVSRRWFSVGAVREPPLQKLVIEGIFVFV